MFDVVPCVGNCVADAICAGVRSAYVVCTVSIPNTALISDRTLSGYRGKSAKPSYSRV
ncbi:Uncharacterised protein [Mycobacterium tuberculosis]|uniref:Uncharacterized protein n=1 Tax=Mycobacterium tuberculosis TaxID=1773 RepID=A0A0U0SWX2_MYCTX|nr:Uncharacterised protein [Mycobacterium tuberculosis]CFS30118.1 Uncharacterised protein [Mycobacterium tuberculosis]COV04995.1 Uncharacterised protein [Mycobacterium tuberculosis]COW75969.1 Uncharacterised protein [Mycobacterium tuberculosis]COW91555.1 Uncharacterised protein [Mycobacterium tuberculosis]